MKTLVRVIALGVVAAAAPTSYAQLPPSPEHGFQPAGSYALSKIESINTANGNMIVTVPLASLPPGRGGSPGFQLNLTHNSKLYDTHIEELPDPVTGEPTPYIFLNPSEQGGWHYNVSPYELQLISRLNIEGSVPCGCTTEVFKNAYIWKLKVIFPDSGEHEFRPLGYTDYFDDGYYNIDPNGHVYNYSLCGPSGAGCSYSEYQATTAGMTYYSTDGTFMRLDISYSPSGGWFSNWTLSFPDGRRIVTTNGVQRMYDRNNNYSEIQAITYNGHYAIKVVDELGRFMILEYDPAASRDYIYLTGANGEQAIWTVKWKTIYAYKPYRASASTLHRGNPYPTTGSNFPRVVDQIILPSQAGSLAYTFGYNAPDTDPYPNYSYGWGEISSITLPSGAQATYAWTFDGPGPPQLLLGEWILQSAVTRKDLNYNAEYDGSSTAITDSWTYGAPTNYGTVMEIIGPDGGVTLNYSDYDGPFARVSYKTENPDGSVIERTWQQNIPYQNPPTNAGVNVYVKTEFTSVKDAAGNLSKTAIKDYNYDKNGNVTRVAEYDWVDYASVPRAYGRPTGIPAGAQPKRVSVSTFFNSTPDASDTSYNGNVYNQPTAAQTRGVLASTEIHDNAQTFSRAEFVYDNPSTTANLIQQKTWDSTKGALTNPLTTGNSISVTTQYNLYGSPILTTDARGFQTQFVYGLVGAVVDLYPTQIKTAYNTSLQRTETREYDFNTGLVTRVTDFDNNVSMATTFDVFGRPTLVKAANGKPEETQTSTEYSDVNRRVIVRNDLNVVGDGKLVKIAHYDQLGRIRLSRQLEDSTTESATDETTGIKVQTRYVFSGSNSYVLISNPYRAATSAEATIESTMGWTRTKNDNSGRLIEVQTFGGAGLPGPWAGNTSGTGAVTTAYDADFATVTDQAGRMRRSMTNALGQLIRVDEPGDPNVNNSLGTNDNPAQPTNYFYDTLGNLITVNQGSQTRTFVYSSLSRLISATNPESGTITYQYDANGNLLGKTDARNITTNYVYDALNRVTSRSYNDGTPPNFTDRTPTVTYIYDSATIPNGKGRLSSVSSSVSTYNYSGYDALGRALGGTQTIGSQSYSISNITYDLAGHLKTMRYPSGRTVTNTFDNAGRLQSFAGTLGDGASRTYANEFEYTAWNGLQQEKLGTNAPAVYHKQRYNSRGQLWDMRASTVPFSVDPANGDRGAIVNYYSNNFTQGGSGADNNGNLLRQENYTPGSSFFQDNFAYDALNRLTSVTELANGTTTSFAQCYSYDRFGNRLVDQANTWGQNIPKPNFGLDQSTNRLSSPAGYTMSYDAAGNLANDTYMGEGARTYDAENRMKQAWANGQWHTYVYDGDGRRIKRIVNGAETWQVYGIGGELVAEYAANSAATSPQKEYGYRNGQLLITATVTSGWGAPPTFQDNPLVVGQTTVRSVHITELRSAIDAVRSHHNLGAYNWQAAAAPGDWITIAPIQEMRTALDQALGAPSGGYAGGLASGQPILKVHIQELRDRVLAAWQSGGSSDVRWLVSDQLGTPRIILDQTGNLPNVSRHDYLPFGEELGAGTGGRTTAQGYTASDGVRQHFTLKERDIETGLDYFLARYYSSMQGRFSGADPLFIDFKRLADPQQLNLYAYVRNNPLCYVDPDGQDIKVKGKAQADYVTELDNATPSFQVSQNSKTKKIQIVDSNGNALNATQLAALGQTLTGTEKELFTAITDSKNHVTIDTTRNDPKVFFGAFKANGNQKLDMADMALLSSKSNAGGVTAAQLVAHETIEAYAGVTGGKGLSFTDAYNYAHSFANGLLGAGGLVPVPGSGNLGPLDAKGRATNFSIDFTVTGQPGITERIDFRYPKPVPPKSLPKPANVTGVTKLP